MVPKRYDTLVCPYIFEIVNIPEIINIPDIINIPEIICQTLTYMIINMLV